MVSLRPPRVYTDGHRAGGIRPDRRRDLKRQEPLRRKCELDNKAIVLSGRGNLDLATKIADYLGTDLGEMKLFNFSDGESYCQILENVRGRDVFVIQPTCQPVNDNLMELLLIARRAEALLGRAHQRRHPLLRLRAAGPQGQARAYPSPPGSWPTCSRPRAPAASSAWTCTPRRSRGSSTSPWTTSSPPRS